MSTVGRLNAHRRLCEALAKKKKMKSESIEKERELIVGVEGHCWLVLGKLPPSLLERLHSMVWKNNKSFTELRKCTVMFVGLQGSGKTRACTQFANYYKKQKGFHPAIVSADTFRPSNFDHLMQTTSSSTIPLFGSFMQSDPVAKTALRGLNWSVKRSKDLILIDTSERHTQVSSLIEEMSQLYEAMKPDLVILVVDSGIGQAAFHQVQLFKQSVQVGGVIMTKSVAKLLAQLLQ
ncbi:hypothetical protein M5689_020512 [Euphorbia peplus]|nr:hypothetical protein M5689_020512 [Euphorbia peplus]